MRRVLGAVGGALGVLAGPAVAAEMASPGDPPVAPAFTSWTGLYIGGNIGYGWTKRSGQVSFGSPSAANPVGFSGGNNGVFQTANGTPNVFPQFFTVAWNSPVDGVIGGGQLGANWQVGSIVLGVEADAEGSSQRKTITAPMPVLGSLVQDYNQPWFATFRGRVGWAFVDGWLAYATGGGAWLDSSRTFTTPGWPYASSSFDLSHIGWAAGGGVEAAIDRNWSWKVEYLHTGTGYFTANVNFLGFMLPWKSSIGDDIVRTGINYRF